MNSISPRASKQINWSTIVMLALGFWLSGSLVFDCLLVPGMLTSGMMKESGFASAGYIIFGTFNHIELICAAIVLAGCLVHRFGDRFAANMTNKSVLTASILLAIALAYTYILTPQMSGMGLSLNMFESGEDVSSAMAAMHLVYWSLEVVKLIAATVLLRGFYRSSCSII